MNIAIILSGGCGSRLHSAIPKQYIKVGNRPIIQYCLETFQQYSGIDKLIIVSNPSWQKYVMGILDHARISKFAGFAAAGSSRQHSIVNGLKVAQKIASPNSYVIIHDAARPFVTVDTIENCIKTLQVADAVMPVLPVKDTIYLSEDGMKISGLLNRNHLFAGQSPEGFHLERYLLLHENMTEQELGLVRGSSEIAYRHGLKVAFIAGDEHNYKITTQEDLNKFYDEVVKKNESIYVKGD